MTASRRISTVADAAEVFRAAMPAGLAEERVWVLPLDGAGRMLAGPIVVSIGRGASATIDPGDVLRAALKAGAEEIIVAHNHPSGDPTPSKADIAATFALKKAADIVGVHLLDHLVIGASGAAGAQGYVSLAACVDI